MKITHTDIKNLKQKFAITSSDAHKYLSARREISDIYESLSESDLSIREVMVVCDFFPRYASMLVSHMRGQTHRNSFSDDGEYPEDNDLEALTLDFDDITHTAKEIKKSNVVIGIDYKQVVEAYAEIAAEKDQNVNRVQDFTAGLLSMNPEDIYRKLDEVKFGEGEKSIIDEVINSSRASQSREQKQKRALSDVFFKATITDKSFIYDGQHANILELAERFKISDRSDDNFRTEAQRVITEASSAMQAYTWIPDFEARTLYVNPYNQAVRENTVDKQEIQRQIALASFVSAHGSSSIQYDSKSHVEEIIDGIIELKRKLVARFEGDINKFTQRNVPQIMISSKQKLAKRYRCELQALSGNRQYIVDNLS